MKGIVEGLWYQHGHYWEYYFWWEHEFEYVAQAGKDGNDIDEAVGFVEYEDEHCFVITVNLYYYSFYVGVD